MAGISALLISRGADVQAANAWGQTPLHTAAMNGYTNVAEFLLKHGAKVNVMSKYNTPLSLAARSLYPDTVKLLLQYGAGANASDYTGRPVLLEAIDGPNKSEKSLWDRELAVVELLLAARANPNMHSAQGIPLQRAVAKGQLPVVRALLAHGARINDYDSDGWTALHYAVNERNLEMVRLLVENGADVNAAGKGVRPPISLTWGEGRGEIKQYLASHGAAQ